MPRTSEQSSKAVEQLFRRWLAKTVDERMVQELKKRGIGVTDELQQSLRQNMRRLAEGYLQGNITFDESGRFVDMGSSRGYSFGKRTSQGTFDDSDRGTSFKRSARGRRPKPWYSKTLYGRLNDLQGAIGYEMMEQSINTLDVLRKV